ncbi:DNA packaging protein [Xanthomonas arboricola]|uniref:terminase small subunit-like protein n=1 Tax=Xanthomonas arboricola TaxID=56448 RepID=UPI000CEF3A78|nr:DNA packaging protein [Xanthomonas arboricola]PPU41835.1 hypothetical protein XaplCFBP3123_01465 [Xanthomonas arboricola pv. populi]
MPKKKTPKKAPAKRPGRPSKYSHALIERIASRLSQGEPLAAICRDKGMPAYRTVKDWMDEKDDLGVATARGTRVSAAIARAREEGFDSLAAECLHIADDGSRDYTSDKDGREVPDHDHIQRSKLRIETRLKLLAKWDPKRYGDKIQQEVSGPEGVPLAGPTIITLVAGNGSRSTD